MSVAPSALPTPTALAIGVAPRLIPVPTLWQAPLVPAALAATAGIVLDRYLSLPLPVSLVALAVALAAWAATRLGRQPGLPLMYLAGAIVALGAAYHHAYRDWYAADDIGNFATVDPRPSRLQGVLAEEPVIAWQPRNDPLQSIPRSDSTQAVLEVRRLSTGDDWLPVSGRARLIVAEHLVGLHVGDEVEVVGRLKTPASPANPGEFDYAGFLRDQRIRAEIQVRKTPDGVIRLAENWPRTFNGWLGVIRGWGQRTLQQNLPHPESGVAMALLLGEGSTMTRADWAKYIRTGVIHVLAISGQHLVVLAAFLWWLLWLLGVRRRRGAWLVAIFLLFYSLLTGGRPPVMRSAVTVCVACGGLVLRRQAMPANSFALAWLLVAVLNPTDLFNTGCQLSFLSVAVLYWGASRWFREPPPDPLDRLADQEQPAWWRFCRRLWKSILISYLISLAIWLVIAPLVAARYHLGVPVGILLAPPLTLLTSIALVAGFLLLLCAAVGVPLVPLFGWVTKWSLALCEKLVDIGDRLPSGHWYLGDVPDWWLWIFYLAVLLLLTHESWLRHWRWLVLAGSAWLCVGLVGGAARPAPDELRITFVAVGHGGCTVLETPDGRTLIYDAGALAGPEVTLRQIAPFLWERSIHRIDEVFLSHADLDHFNGLPELLERFAVGQVTCTPTFADKKAPGVQYTLEVLQRQGIPVRMVHAGDRLAAGAVEIEVLHPPATGPDGNENARSLVLLLRHAGHTLLLTGDLEGPGLQRVLALPPQPIDVLMAPHHGSRAANNPEFAAWARPQVVISCQGSPRGPPRGPDPYTARGARFLSTWPHGAITVRSHRSGLVIETYQTRQRFTVAGR